MLILGKHISLFVLGLCVLISCAKKTDRNRPSSSENPVPGFLEGETTTEVKAEETTEVVLGKTVVTIPGGTLKRDATVRVKYVPLDEDDDFSSALGSPLGEVVRIEIFDTKTREILGSDELNNPFSIAQVIQAPVVEDDLKAALILDPGTRAESKVIVEKGQIEVEPYTALTAADQLVATIEIQATQVVMWFGEAAEIPSSVIVISSIPTSNGSSTGSVADPVTTTGSTTTPAPSSSRPAGFDLLPDPCRAYEDVALTRIDDIGSGTSYDPYLICQPEQLVSLGADFCSAGNLTAANCNQNIRLMRDLDMTGHSVPPIGSSTVPFQGIFDGNLKSIDNLTLGGAGGGTELGLFRNLGNQSVVRDLTLKNVSISSSLNVTYAGALAAWSEGKVYNVHADVEIAVSATSSGTYGGLAAECNGETYRSSAAVDITGAGSFIGGLCGRIGTNATVRFSKATGSIQMTDGNGGGFTTSIDTGAVVEASYATVNIDAPDSVGGFATYLDPGAEVRSSYAKGTTTGGELIGAFVAVNEGLLQDYTWNASINSNSGIQNNSGTANGGQGLTQTQLASAEVFALAGSSYSTWHDVDGEPRLAWEEGACDGLESSYGSAFTRFDDIGSGNAKFPYLICNKDQLTSLSFYCSASQTSSCGGFFLLLKDLDFDGGSLDPIGTNAAPFTGNFDGNDKVIQNFSLTNSGSVGLGLFAKISSATIKRLGIKDAVSNSAISNAGIMVGVMQSSILRESFATDIELSGCDGVGGLVGFVDGAGKNTISNTYTTGTVTIQQNCEGAGGLVGTLGNVASGNEQLFTFNYSHANIFAEGSNAAVGGLFGALEDPTINFLVSNSYYKGSITTLGNVERLGGFVGTMAKGSNQDLVVGIKDSYVNATMEIATDSGIRGGFVGTNDGILMENCYAVTHVNRGINGFLFTSSGLTDTVNSYHDQSLDFVGDDSVTGRTTAAMYTKANYQNWDFNSVWKIDEGVGYPQFRWE